MTNIGPSRKIICFGEFEADLQAGCLFKHGEKIRLRHQLSTVLAMLLERAGEVVPREDIQKRLWPGDIFVDFEINLNTLIARLREVLGDSAESPRYIETLPKRGYRFLAPASEIAASESLPGRRIRLVVLPLSNAGWDPAEEFFGDEMTEEIITALCQAAPDHLAVIARTTALQYRHSDKDVAAVGRELEVEYVVEGGLRRSDGHVAITVQLIRAADQAHVFAKKYEGARRDLCGLTPRIAEDIATHIPSLSGLPRAKPAGKKPSEDEAAYELFLQGRNSMRKMRPPDFAKAKQCLEEAIARDPQFALAYDTLGEMYWWTAFYGFLPPRQACFVGLGNILRAIEIDPSLGETHAMLGQFRQKIDYNWPEVRKEMILALDLAPSSPLVRMRYAVSDLLPHGQLEEAVTQVETGLEFDPLSWMLMAWCSTFLWLGRDHDRAVQTARRCEALDPEGYMPQFILANAYRDSGKFEEGIVYQRRAVERSGGAPQMLGWLGLCLARGGQAAEARGLLQRLEAISAKAYVPPTSFAWIHAGLGEFDEVLKWIERAIEDRDSFVIPIKTYPCLDPLRSDPRFLALVRKMNLEP
ncbi:MAG TPA: winged helix-turn-helix domain-containing protein [Candidatus Aminicenantes bacterium]|nr:winged helix-turn-helix domain-containing protein [Candidatus Aminicenantes bacterium]